MKISILTVGFDRDLEYLKCNLKSIKKFCQGYHENVVVIDDHANDCEQTQQYIESIGQKYFINTEAKKIKESYIRQQAKRMLKNNVSVIVCPSAAISMKQDRRYLAPIHNSIAPVKILLDEGVDIKLGIDNIEDLFMPLVDGDIWFETRLLMEATRIYNHEDIINLVTSI